MIKASDAAVVLKHELQGVSEYANATDIRPGAANDATRTTATHFSNKSLNRCGWERRYCLGARTWPPSSAAACHGQCGSYKIVRANAIMSASPVATIASACSNPLIIPTAITGMRTADLIARASGT